MVLFSTINLFFQKRSGILLFLSAAVIGLLTFNVYGISWDEDYQREIGLVSWNYIFSNDQSLLTYAMRDYGVGFELPLIAIEKLVGFTEEKDIYLMRHMVSHLFFLLGAYYAFQLIRVMYNNTSLAIIAFLVYVLHPLIYGHSFFNTKDVPFLSLFTICFYFTYKAFQTKSILHYFILGILLGVLINIRIMGSLLLLSILFFLMLDAILEKQILYNFKRVALLLGTTITTLVLFWPYLWNDPIAHYVEAFKNMSNFRWNNSNLFKGELQMAADMRWDYIPTWFSITTPIPYLVVGVFGIVTFFFFFFKKPMVFLQDQKERMNLIFLICFLLPILMIIILHSVLYDGWRHLYFIYPPFVFLSMYGLHKISPRLKKLALTGVVLSLFSVLIFMFSNFPFQYVYFNYFVTYHNEPDYIRKNYEMDYWGVSFKQAVEYILKSDTSSILKLRVEQFPEGNLLILLEPEQRKRLRFVCAEEADYFVTNYRWHPQDYSISQPKVHALMVQNYAIVDIYKLKE